MPRFAQKSLTVSIAVSTEIDLDVDLVCFRVDDLNEGFGLRSSVRSLRGLAIFI